MQRLMIAGFVTVGLLAAATTMLRSHSSNYPGAAADMMLAQTPRTAAGVNKLPVEEFDDMSLVYSNGTKR
jgi:hypothetical protein